MPVDSPLQILVRTADFAARKHTAQKRKDNLTPYINHPIGVANILANEAGIDDLVTLQAAILHDTVEDTDTSLDELEHHFGRSVRSIVAEVTDDKALDKKERKRLQVVKAPSLSSAAKHVKLADKLYNLRDICRCRPLDERGVEPWTERRCQEYFQWAADVVRALGRGTNPTLERLLAEVLSAKGVKLHDGV